MHHTQPKKIITASKKKSEKNSNQNIFIYKRKYFQTGTQDKTSANIHETNQRAVTVNSKAHFTNCAFHYDKLLSVVQYDILHENRLYVIHV